MDRFQVVYFLEDRAHEGFIKALVERIAGEEGLAPTWVEHDVRSARYGSKAVVEWRKFLQEVRHWRTPHPDLWVIAIDGNCHGYTERVAQLRRYLKPTDAFQENVVFAIPDPHVERWYLIDQRALKEATGLAEAPGAPPYKCKKNFYKDELRRALAPPPVQSLLGGPEFAERIVQHMGDLRDLARQEPSFAKLVNDLRAQFRKRRGAT